MPADRNDCLNFLHHKQYLGLIFACRVGFDNRDWRGVFRIAQFQAPLNGGSLRVLCPRSFCEGNPAARPCQSNVSRVYLSVQLT